MNFKTTILLLLLLCVAGVGAVGAVLWGGGGEGDGPSDRRVNDGSPSQTLGLLLPGLRASQVVRVEIERPSELGAPLAWERTGDRWRQVEPVVFSVVSAEVEAFIAQAATLQAVDRFDPGGTNRPDRETAGVAADVGTRVTLVDRSGERRIVTLGTEFLAGRGYAAVEGDLQIAIVPLTLHRGIPVGEGAAWRAQTLDPPPASALSEVRLWWSRPGTGGAGESVGIERINGRWMLTGDGGAGAGLVRADAAAVESLISYIEALQVVEFSPLWVPQRSLPEMGIQLVRASTSDVGPRAEPAAWSLRFEDFDATGWYARWQPGGTENRVPTPLLKLAGAGDHLMPRGREEFLDRWVFDLDPREVAGVRVELEGGESFAIERTTAGWRFAEPGPGYPVDQELAAGLAASLASLRAVRVQEGASPLADEPLAGVTLTGLGGGNGELVRLYADEQTELIWVVRDDTPGVIYIAPRAEAAGAVLPVVSLRERVIFQRSQNTVQRIRIEGVDGEIDLRPDSSTSPVSAAVRWTLSGHGDADQPTAESLLKAVSPLRAVRWVPAPESASFTLTLRVGVGEGGDDFTIEVDPRLGVGRIVGDDTDAAFMLPADLLALLEAEYRPRTLIPATVGDLRSVTRVDGVGEHRVGGAGSTTIRRDNLGRYVTDLGAAVDQRSAATLLDTLAGLRAERFLDEPAPDGAEPVAKLDVLHDSGQVYHLTLYPERIGSLDGQRFLLPESAYAALRIPLEADG